MLTRRPINYKWIAVIAIFAVVASTACTSRKATKPARSATENPPTASAVNINTASAEELQKIPYIGEKLAAQIVEHRRLYGLFRRREDLMLIRGISDTRFRKMQDLVRVN